MSDEEDREITQALHALDHGAPDAMDGLVPRVYAELRRIAHRQLRAERPEHRLSTTAVVHAAYLELAGHHQVHWVDRAHFFAVASRTMRRILTVVVDWRPELRARLAGAP